MRVLFLVNIPSPYRVDFFNELGNLCDLTVLYERETAKNRNEKWKKYNQGTYKEVFLKGNRVGVDTGLCFSVLKYLNKNNFDIIVIGGYSTPTAMLAIFKLKFTKTQFVLNSDGGIIKSDKIFLKKIKTFFIHSANWWLSTGKTTDEYLAYYGANKDEIFRYPFTSIKQEDILNTLLSKEQKNTIKKGLNIKEEKVIVSIGQLIDRKGFDILLKASELIDKNIGVYIIGGKPTEKLLKQKKDLKLDNVHFVDFVEKKEVLKYLEAATIFVLATRWDIWGLVINEAMACGLPIITTNKCVAGLELVRDNENGFIVPINDAEALADKINYIINDDNLLQKMAQNSVLKIQEYTTENMAQRHMDIFKEIRI